MQQKCANNSAIKMALKTSSREHTSSLETETPLMGTSHWDYVAQGKAFNERRIKNVQRI